MSVKNRKRVSCRALKYDTHTGVPTNRKVTPAPIVHRARVSVGHVFARRHAIASIVALVRVWYRSVEAYQSLKKDLHERQA